MAKPIALFYYPDFMFDESNGERKGVSEIIQAFNKMMPDYYWLFFPNHNIKFPKLQVYFEKDFTDVEYDEIIEKINRKIDSLKPKNNVS